MKHFLRILLILFLGLFLNVAIGNEVVYAEINDDLVAYYPFNGDADDKSGNTNDGVVHGAILTHDRFGSSENAYLFDGVDDFIDIGNLRSIVQEEHGSFSIWININAFRPGVITFLFESDLSANDRFYLGIINQRLIWGYMNVSISTPDSSIQTHVWYHISGTWVNGQFRLYLNGSLVESKQATVKDFVNNNFGLGKAYNTDNRYYDGKIDNFRIYNRVISESEIQQLYYEGDGPTVYSASISTDKIQTELNGRINGSGSIVGNNELNNVTYVWKFLTPESSEVSSTVQSVNIISGYAQLPEFILRTDMEGSWQTWIQVLTPNSDVESSKITYEVVSGGIDNIPPGQVNYLSGTTGLLNGSIKLNFTAPGDDGLIGTSDHYEVRYSASPITQSNWDSASTYVQTWIPSLSGTTQMFSLSGFTPGQDSWFAIKAVDEAGNASNISASVQVTAGLGGTLAEQVVGGMTVHADNIIDNGGSIFTASGNVIINELLHYSGDLEIDVANATVSGNGEIYLADIPFYGKIAIYNGDFILDANEMIADYIDQNELTLKIGGLDVGIVSLEIKDQVIDIAGYLKVGTLDLLIHFTISQAEGIKLEDGDIKIGTAELTIENVDIGSDHIAIQKALFTTSITGEAVIENLMINASGVSFNNGEIGFMGFDIEVDNLEITQDSFSISGSMEIYQNELSIQALEISSSGISFEEADFNIAGLVATISSSTPEDGSSDMILSGMLQLPDNMGGTTVAADFILHRGGGIDLKGKIEGISLALEGTGYGLEDAWLEFDTQNQRFYGGAQFQVPLFPFMLEAEVGVQSGYLNKVYVAADDIDKCILYGPPAAPVPIVYLQRIGAGLDELMPGPPSLILSGDLALTAGPQWDIDGTTYFAVKGTLEIIIDTGGKLTGTGTIYVISEDGKLASATVILEKGKGLEIYGSLNVVDILKVSGEMRIDNRNNFNGALDGGLYTPEDWWLIGGKEFGSIKATAENQYISTSVGWWFISVTVTYDGDSWGVSKGGTKYSLPEYAAIDAENGTWRVGGNLKVISAYRAGVDGIETKGIEILTLNQDVPYALFQIQWTNEEDIDITLTAPDGTEYGPAISQDDVFYNKNLAINEAFYAVENPAQGTWQVDVPDTPDIGEYVVQMIIPNEVPQITITAPVGPVFINPVSIEWNAQDLDNDAGVSLYYDNNNSGFNGHLIVSGLSEDTDIDYNWDTLNIPNGTYYIYAKIDDGYNAPVYQYSDGTIKVEHTLPPAVPDNIAVVPYEDRIYLSWDPSLNAAGYRVYYGSAYSSDKEYHIESSGNATGIELKDLNPGWVYRLFVTAYNEEGVESDASQIQLVTLKSIIGNNISQFTSRPVIHAMSGESYEYQVLATDFDNDTLIFSLTAYPTGMTIDPVTGLITWTPDDTILGNHTISVKVEDPFGGMDTQTYILNVCEPWNETPPRITSTPPALTIRAGDIFTYQVECTDADNDTFQILVKTGPVAMNINTSGLITWQTTPSDVGTHLITIQALDQDNMSDSQTFQLIVVNELDIDHDGIQDSLDNCPYNYNPNQKDQDIDDIGDICDTCPTISNASQTDTDNDGLGDACETGCTEFDNPDTDNDGIIDGLEDLNRNMIVDSQETSPCIADSDSDDLNDGDELLSGTNPLNRDTDEDGMKDGWEQTNNLDPLFDDAFSDKDNDGFSNLREYLSLTDPDNISDTPSPISIYVDQSSSLIPELGTQTQPVTLIQSGIDLAGPEDSVQVAPGLYYENIYIGKDIDVIGSGAASTIIDGSDMDLPAVEFEDVTSGSIFGFTIKNGYQSGIRSDNADIIISNNIISNTIPYYSIEGDGITALSGSDLTVTNNIIFDNGITGIYLDAASSADVINNTITGNGWYGIDTGTSNLTSKNNIITYNGVTGINSAASLNPNVTYNNLFGNAGLDFNGVTPGSGNIFTDPSFIDFLNNNFNLRPDSPNIDAADSTNAPGTDFMGNVRFDAIVINTGIGTYAYYDIGALEFTGSIPGDTDMDNDVDGKDIAAFADQLVAETAQITIEQFAAEFGK
ncbi:MAG: right-handed parallel beta-helix repeat-containing protein [Desulfobacula sp.]|uniref:LamG-like jellyroll fold domain-containing protein n=1 Tax=Desulfobacula sp. TaxID=2593537 RepID=UPI0025C5FC03|nr:LamG-like jellyroll fold domain-containing protein [Desulfobacula sp.]MCD4722958.1 right-handed parallel beta-helix repeat-containing protein [Desulfobacula sp.]